MSVAISTGELALMRDDAELTMLDECQIGVKSGGAFGSDPGDKTFTYGDAVICGVDLGLGRESSDGAQRPDVDAVISLPHGTTITAASRIKVTKRLGVAVTNLEYAVLGTPKHGALAIVCNCKLITGSAVQ